MAVSLYSKDSVDSLLSPKLSISSLTNAAATTLNATAPTTDQVLSFDGTELKWATVSGGGGAAWGGITGTLSSQTDLQNALDLKAPLASPTFTGTVTIPAGASISGFAPLSSPTLTGTPLSTTAAADTNTTQIATTAFVVGQASSTTPASNGTAAVGTSLKYARADHVHANVLPTGGTTGQVLSKVDGTNYNVQWSTAGGSGGGTDIQTFGSSTTSGTYTWTKPAGAKWVEIILYGGGGGGGAGYQNATTIARSGAGGGGAGAYFYGIVPADQLGATESVVVAGGGAGGTPRPLGLVGLTGGTPTTNTTFNNYRAFSGQGGNGAGQTSAAAGPNRTSFVLFGSTLTTGGGGIGNPTTGTAGASGNTYVTPCGGGGGAGAAASSTAAAAGGNGGGCSPQSNASGINITIAGGAGGTVGGVAAAAGTSQTTQYNQAGTGGGGGAYITGVAGGTGGAGGWPAGGGGGGSASDSGFSAGTGGAGANGFAVVVTHC